MSDTALAVELRQTKGKGGARKLRAQGQIPGILNNLSGVEVSTYPHSAKN